LEEKQRLKKRRSDRSTQLAPSRDSMAYGSTIRFMNELEAKLWKCRTLKV